MQNFIGQLLLTIIAIFGGFWLVVSISGWGELAQKYRTDEIPRTLIEIKQGLLRGIPNGSIKTPLKVGVTDKGLYLAPSLFPFDFFMSPVLIPWNQILTWKVFNLNSSQEYYKLHLGNPEVIIFQLNGDVRRELENQYGETIFFNKLGNPS